jgi:hypothetical protein
VGWTAPAGRASSRPARSSPPRARKLGRGSRGPLVFPGPAQRLKKKSISIFFLLFLMKKHLENDFLVILAPKIMK